MNGLDINVYALYGIAIAGGIALYLVPTCIGMGKKNAGGIFVVNLLLGWSLVGWLAAFIWACVSPKVCQATDQLTKK
jgi:hypothetical protein